MYGAVITFVYSEGLFHACSLERAVSGCPDRIPGQSSDSFLVVNNQNSLCSSVFSQQPLDRRRRALFDLRQINPEAGTDAESAGCRDSAPGVFDYAIDNRHPKPAARPLFSGRKEGLEHVILCFGIHAMTGVSYGNHNI